MVQIHGGYREYAENLVAVIDVGGEGCIYNKDGEVIQGITNVLGMVDNFQTVKGKAVIPLDRIDTFKDGKVLFYADCGNNGRGGKAAVRHALKELIFVSLDRIY